MPRDLGKRPIVRFADMAPAQQAGILANTDQFQVFAARRANGYPNDRMSTSEAAEFIRQSCNVTSRREIKNGSDANKAFQALRTEYDVWRGAIPKPRDMR